MTANPILDDLHAARAKLLADAGGDLQTLVATVRKRRAKSGRRVVSGPVEGARHTEECAGKTAETIDCDGFDNPTRSSTGDD